MKILGQHVYAPMALMAAADFLLAGLAVVGVQILGALARGAVSATLASLPWQRTGVFAALVVVGLAAVGLYQPKQRLRRSGVLARVVVGVGLAGTGLALFEFLFIGGFGGPIWLANLAVAALLIGAERLVTWNWLLELESFRRRVLVFGAGKAAESLLRLRRRSDRRGFDFVAFVPIESDETTVDDPRVVRLDGTLLDYVVANRIDEIVVAMDDRRRGFPGGDLLSCRFKGVKVVELLTFLERETGRVNVDLVNPSWLIFSETFGARANLDGATRIFDFCVALVLLVIAAPFILLVALAVIVDDGFPAIYRQRRVGKDGVVFTLYKFRSMIKNAEVAGRAQWATVGDSRVTRTGALLRKLRLDELPQLFNVLGGHMSLVGPRPERPEFVDRLARDIPYYQERHLVRPGVTGWAQLSYPYGASDQDALAKLQFDLYYIKHKSLVFDLVVLLQTAEVVLWGKGAR